MSTESRHRAWATRRKKYGQHGHSGQPAEWRPIKTGRWNERMKRMQLALIKLYGEGVLSEGQVSKATRLDRITCRRIRDELQGKSFREIIA